MSRTCETTAFATINNRNDSVMRKKRLAFPVPEEPRRLTIGVLVASEVDRVEGVLIAAKDRGLLIHPEILGTATVTVPEETTDLYGQMLRSGSGVSLESLVRLREELAEVEAEVISRLPPEAGVAPGRVLAVGIHDPGCWVGSAGSPGYLGLCDPARVAELTGANIIDDFPARDLAGRGQGGPISALAEWTLLRTTGKNRVLLDLRHTIRIGFFPAEEDPLGAGKVLEFEVGPGMRLPDHLARQLTGGEHAFDPGGRLAVQGQKIDSLLEHWLADSYFVRPLPRWSPRGVRPERFLNDAVRMAVENDWSVRDLLCTATHLLAESIAQAIRHRLPEDARVDEIILTGGGRHNGMLLRELAARLPEIPFIPGEELGISKAGIEPAAIGVLTMFHLDQVPGNSTSITGTDLPRVLGRLTPGSPQSLQRLLNQISGTTSTLRPLRAAI